MEKEQNYRIAVFGTSRSGKDYTIEGAIEILRSAREFTHFSPISRVHEILAGRSLKNMDEKEKEDIVRQVRDEIDRMSTERSLIVDEHYCFPSTYGGKVLNDGYNDEKLPRIVIHEPSNGLDYEVVFFDDISKNDLVVNIRQHPQVILDRFSRSEGCKRNTDITLKDVIGWQEFELKNLERLCSESNVKFIDILLDDTEEYPKKLAEIIIQKTKME